MHSAPKTVVSERADAVVAHLVEALTRRSEAQHPAQDRALQPEVVLEHAPEAVQEFLFAQGWTDGLPVVPVTTQAFVSLVQDSPPLVGQIPDIGHVRTLLLVPHSVCPGTQFPPHCPMLQTSEQATVAVVHAPVASQVCT